MRTIYKFPIALKDEQTVDLPLGAKIVFVGEQGGQLNLWVDVEDTNPGFPRTIHVHGTGHPIEAKSRHVGTVQMGRFVWHVFEG
jgi:hypothetical protein